MRLARGMSRWIWFAWFLVVLTGAMVVAGTKLDPHWWEHRPMVGWAAGMATVGVATVITVVIDRAWGLARRKRMYR